MLASYEDEESEELNEDDEAADEMDSATGKVDG